MTQRYRQFCVILIGVWIQLGCTATHPVRTVGRGNLGIEASLGGPIINDLAAPLATPNLYVGARYGVTDTVDVSASYNLTAPFIPGIALDLVTAAHWVPIQPGVGFQRATADRGWALATGLSLHSITDFQHGYVGIPVADVAFGWRRKWFNPFLGVALGLNFYRPLPEDSVLMVSPFVGCDFILTEALSLVFKLIAYDVANNMYGNQLGWIHLRDDPASRDQYGVLGLIFGFSWDWQPGGEQ